ncbi:MAG TPA: PRC-barrel domain-containing protein [Geminicoccus sp.]|jgi:hypothetical protein|uniref:PRC-barrel domain-containing protein n=1 Tax=Geminicoccus sp. TaxID=2024832 RepID=UPI002E2ED096|nr:PRC-barrel domain-containing protein [Geminicoccus sp.]HEX2524706.1 PRC-barrel domain-containing protein [Geminicoccus sp.]
MKRLLLLSTAMLGFAMAPALAQETAPAQPADPAQQTTVPPVADPAAPAADPAAPAADMAAPATEEAAPTTDAPEPTPVPEQQEGEVRAESLMGVDVTNGQDTIGQVSDLVVTEDGQVQAIVVGVGGFLGIGEKLVALDWESVKLTRQDDDRTFEVSATREELEQMPAYRTLEDKEAEAAAQRTQQQMDQGGGAMPGTAAPGTAAPGATTAPAAPAAPATTNP